MCVVKRREHVEDGGINNRGRGIKISVPKRMELQAIIVGTGGPKMGRSFRWFNVASLDSDDMQYESRQ